jgi:hypothetical protein
MIRILSPVAALLCAAAVFAQSQTQTLQLTATQDNTLYEDPAGLLSNGAGQYLFVGTNATGVARRALLRFDISGIPAKSRVVDVQLDLVSSRSTDIAPMQATLHRVTTPWGEGTSIGAGGEGGGGPATAGDATWTHGIRPTTPWTNLGGDFAAEVSSEATMPVIGPVSFQKTIRLIADVQDWLDGRLPNHGWIVLGDESGPGTARRLDSRQNTSPTGVVPRLRVTFAAPGNAPSFGVGCSTSGGMNFTQSIQGQPVGGQTTTLVLQSGVPFGLFITAVSYDVLPQPWTVDGCDWWLRPIPHPNLGIRFHDVNGITQIPVAIPVSAVLYGTPFALQSILVDLVHPRQYALSNAHLVVFG